MKSGDARQLREIPIDQLLRAGSVASKACSVPWKPDVIDASLKWAPTVDGHVLPEAPFAANAPAISKHIPLLLGTVQNEMSPALYDPSLLQLSADGLRKRVETLHGANAANVIAAFRSARADATPIQLISLISSAVFRQNVLEQAAMKAAQGGAPAWLYLFARGMPLLDGRAGAFHCSELPFMFDNTDRAETMSGGGAAARALAARMTASWVSFARTGNPAAHGLPGWKPFTPSGAETMVIDETPRLRRNLDDVELATLV